MVEFDYTEMAREIDEAIDRGFNMLLERGDTFEYVNLDTMSMTSACNCVTAQRHGRTYYAGLMQLGFSAAVHKDVGPKYGFTPPLKYRRLNEAWDYLQDRWVEKITAFRLEYGLGQP